MINRFTYIFFILICSCGHGQLSPEEYLNWHLSEQSGLRKVKEIADIKIELVYLNKNFLESKKVLNKSDGININSEVINDDESYFVLKLYPSKSNKNLTLERIDGQEDYYHNLSYFDTYMQDDIYFVSGKDTLPCEMYHYERNYSLSKVSTFLLSFKRKQTYENIQAVINPRILNTGIIKFNFKTEDIINAPLLKTVNI